MTSDDEKALGELPPRTPDEVLRHLTADLQYWGHRNDAAALRALATELAALRRVAEAARAWSLERGRLYRTDRENALAEALAALEPGATTNA